jgi:DNA-binding SARP family transcriptional activator
MQIPPSECWDLQKYKSYRRQIVDTLVIAAVNLRGTMDIECYQTSLARLLERICHLEQDLLELRQCLQGQPAPVLRPANAPTSLSISPGGSRGGVAGTADWDIRCLGSFHLRCAGREVPPCKSRRGQSLLKYLLASPGFATSTDVLVDCFWPQTDAEAGARNLQVAVHALRCSLRGCGPGGSDETVLFRHHRYLLNPALSIVQDVDAFRATYERGLGAAHAGNSAEAIQAFEEARATYTDDYLADPYEEWATSTRLSLQDRRLHVLERLGAYYSQAETWEAAIACYRELLAVDGYREDAYRLLMRCYAAVGRPAEVKQTYLTCRRVLHRDLHLVPAAETTLLYQHLMQSSTPLGVY